MKIKELYDKLGRDKTIFFQVKDKIALLKIIKEMNEFFDRFDEYHLDYITLKNTWFILGNWRDGMFKLITFNYWKSNYGSEDQEVYILADTKESPLQNTRHLDQIDDLIKTMDKYRNYFIQKRVDYDNDFNIVKKVKEHL